VDIGNSLRVLFAFLLIKLVRVPWRLSEKLLRRQFPYKDHYLIMNMFRRLTRSFPVTIQYRNPVANDESIVKLALDLCENNQQWHYRMKEWYELEWMKVISLGMGRVESFIDIGANIGAYSVTIAQAFPDRRVIAVEPVSSNYSRLEENIRLNGLRNVEAVNAAIAERKGPVEFYLNPVHDGGGSLLELREYRTGDIHIDAANYQARHPHFVPTVKVEGLPLDGIITTSSALKIDVEGAEVPVLKSGLAALNKGLVDLIVVEVSHDSTDEVVRLLDGAGFDCFIYGQRVPIADVSQFDSWAAGRMRDLGNVLCLRRGSELYDPILDSVAAGIIPV